MLPLDPTDDRVHPAFKDTSSCAKWLSQLQLTNLNLAHGTLRTQVDLFNLFPVRGKERLKTLETLRETVSAVQADFAKKLTGKKLPLADDEFTTLISLANLWQSMLNGYLRCLQALDAGDTSLSSETTLLYQRCMLYCGLQIGEFLHVGCEPDGKSWQRLHTIYARVEELGLQKETVQDKTSRSGRPVSCLALYAKTLLLHRARIAGLSRRSHWQIADRWLESWGEAYSVDRSCSMSRDDAPPLVLDLSASHGLMPIKYATSADSMRFLPMVPLSKVLRVKTILLQQGQLPLHLDLGEELNSKDCTDLLNKLHRYLCEHRVESLADETKDNPPLLRMCIGLENIHSQLSGKPFKTPPVADLVDKETQKQIETFGRVLDQTDRHNLKELGFLAEDWLVEDDGLLHARLLRKSNVGERLGLNQIVGLINPQTQACKIGVVTLTSVTRKGQLYIGVRYLPGLPRPAIVRGNAFNNLLSGAAAALILPEMPNLRIPASIVIPRDWFSVGRQLELSTKEVPKQMVMLGISVDKGHDYERVSYTAAG